jgi:hypothetical protein
MCKKTFKIINKVCPEETLAVYDLFKEIDDLGRFPLYIYQQNQIIITKNKFIDGYVKINHDSFKSKKHNDEKKEPISLDLGPL